MQKIKIQPNPNLVALFKSFENQTYRGVNLEGSSRSGKTWASVSFLCYLGIEQGEKKVIILRESYESIRKNLSDDFNRVFPKFGFESPFSGVKNTSTFFLNETTVQLAGAENVSDFHGAGSDFFWVNEATMGVPKAAFDQLEQRCRRFWWMDYNPAPMQHWAYDLEKRKDVLFLRTTFMDNPQISDAEKAKILSYDPNNQINIDQGTADPFMWSVYGLGVRVMSDDVIFKAWDTYSDDPDQFDLKRYGLDFGYTSDPNACVQVIISGRDLYLREIFYRHVDLHKEKPGKGGLGSIVADYIKKSLPNFKNYYFIADNAPDVIYCLKEAGIVCIPAIKREGSILAGIAKINSYRVHIHRDSVNLQRELYDYRYKRMKSGEYLTVNGNRVPVDKKNHAIDAARYGVAGDLNY